ncbi:hypothetical protein Tco_0155368 [Tanacetum coccineum]
MAISSSSSSSSFDSEVQKCSKCLESFKCLQKNYDTEREKHNKAKLEIRGYEIALESLEARILGHEKNELAWGERYEFQNYDLKCREIKINNLNLELEKVVKERDELKLKIEKWEGSSKNLTKILNSQMSTHDNNGLGFGIQMDDLSNKYDTDSENSLTVFEERSSDEESTLENNRFTKANKYHVVPPPITGNPLTLRPDISFVGLDEYAFRNKIIESETTKTNKTVDDEDDVCVVKTVSSVKPNATRAVRSQTDKSGQISQKQGIGFKKLHKIKACLSISTVRPFNIVRPVSTTSSLASKITQSNSVIRPNHPRLDIVRPKASNSPIKRSYFTQPIYRTKDLKPDVKTFGVKNMTTVGTKAVVSKGKVENVRKNDKWLWKPKMNYQDHVYKYNGSYMLNKFEYVDPKGISKISMDLRMDRSSPGKYNSSMVFHMANLKYSDKHNMVAFLKKPNESVGFTKVVDFIKGTSLRYALTHNPTIYDSLVKQFWQTATVRTLANGTQQLVASIDSKEYTITEASVRSKLQLADATGIHNLSDAEIYAGLATLGPKSGGWDQFGSTIATALICLSSNRDIDDDPLVSLVRESMKEKSTDFVTPTKASGEAQEEEISPTILQAAKTLSKVASQGVSKEKLTDKGKRYRGRARSMAKNIDTGLDDEEEINTGREEINTGIEKVSTGSTKVSASEDWDTIRAKLEANAELSKDVLGQDLPKQDFAKRMVDMVNQRKKHFAEERAKAKRNKPMTLSQVKDYMSNNLTNQGTWKLSQLKKLNTKAKLKRYGEELQTKTSKKQKIDDKDVPAIGEKVTKVKKEEQVKRTRKRNKQKARKGINVDKSAQEDSEIDKEESIIRANGTDTVYMSFGAMIKDFTREDLIELYRLVMQKYGTNRPEDEYDRVLWSDLRTMFDAPLIEDAI